MFIAGTGRGGGALERWGQILFKGARKTLEDAFFIKEVMGTGDIKGIMMRFS